jgi:hypothetical protein
MGPFQRGRYDVWAPSSRTTRTTRPSPTLPSGGTTNWKEAVQLERDVVEQVHNGALTSKAGPRRLFVACDAYLAAKPAARTASALLRSTRSGWRS